MSNGTEHDPGWWKRLPLIVRTAMVGVLVFLAIIALTAINKLLGTVWLDWARNEFTDWRTTIVGVLALAMTLVLSFLWLLVLQGLYRHQGYEEALRQTESILGKGIQKLATIVEKDLPSQIGFCKSAGDTATSVFNSYNGRCDRLLTEAERLTLKDLVLLHSREYIEYIEKVNRDYIAAQTQTKPDNVPQPVERVVLYGTMVGFAFLLPSTLRRHLCGSRGRFSTLTIIASDHDAEENKGETRHLAYYPLWLAIQFLLEILDPAKCERFANRSRREGDTDESFTITIALCYLHHDLLDAAIWLPHQEVAVLQALDARTFERVVAGKELHRGFRYTNTTADNDPYDRLSTVLSNLQGHFDVERTPKSTKRRCEIWKLAFKNGTLVLNIIAPHWACKDGQLAYVLNAGEYDEAVNGQQLTGRKEPWIEEVQLGGTQTITDFLKQMVAYLSGDGITGTDIRTLRKAVEDATKGWAASASAQMKCPCKT